MSVRFAKGEGVPRGPGARAQGPHWTADKSAALTFTGAPRTASAQVVETGPHALNGPRPVGYFFLSAVSALPLRTLQGVFRPRCSRAKETCSRAGVHALHLQTRIARSARAPGACRCITAFVTRSAYGAVA